MLATTTVALLQYAAVPRPSPGIRDITASRGPGCCRPRFHAHAALGAFLTGEGSVCGDGSVRPVAEVDDAEAIAVRVREHDEVRVVGVAVPADSFCPEGHEARCLGCLLGRTGYM